jgi:WD40 repeat protein
MAKVFVSYSRKDIEFAKRLTEELKKNNMEFWVDWDGIPPTVDFMKKIEKGIEESDAFLFLISPDSVKSKVCGEELAHAVKNGKRLIPLIVRDVKSENLPEALSHINWISFREQDNFDESFQKLLLGINTDFEWVDVHSRLLVRALEWEQENKDKSFLLRGKDLHDAETQLAINTSKDPHPTDLHREYILNSRQAADRQRRWFTVMAVVIAIVMFVLGVYGLYQANAATREAKRANESLQREEIAKNHALAKEIESKIIQLSASAVAKIDQNFSEALLLGVEAYLHAKENQTHNFTAQSAMTKILQSNPGLIQVILGHTDWVNTVAVSPDGKLLATGSWDTIVNLWDISNPAFPVEMPSLIAHTTPVEGLAFSSDGKTLATSGNDNLILWDTSDPSAPKMLSKIEGYYINPQFSQDNKILSSLRINPDANNVGVLFNVSDRKSPEELSQLDSRDESVDMDIIALSPDRNLAFTLLRNGDVLEWDIADPNNPVFLSTLEGDDESVHSMAMSADGKTLALGNSDTTIALWDVSDPAAPVKSSIWSGHSLPITSLAFSADGDTLASSSNDAKAPIILWDISNRNVPKKTRTINGHTLTITSLLFSQNNDILIDASRDGTVMLWDVSNPKTNLELGSIKFPEDEITTGMAFQPNSNLLTSWNSNEKLTVWDISNLANPNKTETLNGPISTAVFSHDGKLMASNAKDNVVTLWNGTDFTSLSTIKTEDDYMNSIALNTDGKTLAIIGDKITFWDITDPKKPVQLASLSQSNDLISAAAFNSDGKVMASIADINIVLWDVSDPASPTRLSTPLEGHSKTINSIAFSPTNPGLLASASSDKTVILWDITDPGSPKKVNTLGNHLDWVNSVSFSPDGTLLASGSYDKQINLWNITNLGSPDIISKMIGHSESVSTVAFSPQGDFVASLGDDNKIIFWDINPESWAQKACSIAGGDFTIIEWNQYFPSENYRQTCEPFYVDESLLPSTGGGPIITTPTAVQSSIPLPVCTNDQLACTAPASDKLDEFCVDNNSYGLYQLPLNTTFEVLTPGFTCISEKNNSLGEPRISCTGPKKMEFQVTFCNSTCSNTLETSIQCEAGFGLNSAQGCCAPLSTVNNGCVTETLILAGCN